MNIGIIGSAAVVIERIALWQQTYSAPLRFVILNNFEDAESLPINTFAFSHIDTIIEQVEVVDILVDSEAELFPIFQKASKAHKNIFIANPFVLSIDCLQQCALLVKESAIKCQPGLYLRFQEDIMENCKYAFRFLESGISLTTSHAINQSKWLALVNNHVDLLAYLAQSPIKRIAAFSLPLNGMANALLNFRIQFENMAVGNCTINTNALVEEQVSLLFNEDQQKLIVWTQNNTMRHDIFDQNCVITSMKYFIQSIMEQVPTKVTIFDALNTVELTRDIINQIEVL